MRLPKHVQPKRTRAKKTVELSSFPQWNPNPVGEVDLEGRIHYLNPAATRLFPTLKKKSADHPWLADWKSVVDEFRAGKTKSMFRQVTVDGRRFQQAIHYIDKTQRLRFYGFDIHEQQTTQQKFATLLETIQSGFWLHDLSGKLLEVNEAYCLMSGYSRHELLQMHISDLEVNESTSDVLRHIQAVRERGSDQFESRHRRKDGSVFDVDIRSSLLEPKSGHIATFVWDITKRKKEEAKLIQLNRTFKALSESNQAMMHAQNESELLNDFCRIVVNECGHAMVWVGYAEDDEAKSVRPLAHAGFEEGYIDTLNITWADTERGRGPTGTAIRTGKPSGCRNMLTDPKFKPWRAEALKRGYASSIVLPLLADGRAFGSVTIYSREPDQFSEEETELLAELADDLAFGITAIRLREAHAQAEKALRASRDELERVVAERTVELRVANARLRALTRDIVTTQEEERRRVSRELHDEAGQALIALKLSLQTVRDELPLNGDGYRQQLDEALSLTDKTIEQIRMLAHDLRPPALDAANLDAALEGLCREFTRRTHIEVHFYGANLPNPGSATVCLYRFMQEALTNAARHGRATTIHVRLEKDAEHAHLSVEDNGQGFDPSSVLSNQLQPKSMGLIGMQERLESVGGWLEIDSQPGRGARLVAHVPLEPT